MVNKFYELLTHADSFLSKLPSEVAYMFANEMKIAFWHQKKYVKP